MAEAKIIQGHPKENFKFHFYTTRHIALAMPVYFVL